MIGVPTFSLAIGHGMSNPLDIECPTLVDGSGKRRQERIKLIGEGVEKERVRH